MLGGIRASSIRQRLSNRTVQGFVVIARDQIVATVVFVLALASVMNSRADVPDTDNRIAVLALTFVLVLLWRPVARLPTYGLMSRMASDYGRADLGVPVAIISWGLFLFFAYTVVFR
ncbi:MAG: hypothetical protein ACI8PT_002266 [Gammaproteobacteria bacterium]|jgi:hypothetical protein